MTMSLAEREIERQKRSNLNALEHVETFANHRRHLTGLLVQGERADSARPPPAQGSLCVLGAGNCGDLDLERLRASYASIHLVDLDEQALERARERQTESTRSRLVTHGPTDLSGVLAPIERWRAMQITPEELLAHPGFTSARIEAKLGGPFSTVLSACVLSQMQLAVRQAFSDTHPLFDAVSYTVNLTHLRTLARLTQPGGRAVLASDIATEEMAPLKGMGEKTDLRQLLARLISLGDVFNVVHPDVMVSIAKDDPSLAVELAPAGLADVWLWHNGPQRIFLVYALELNRA